MTYICHSKLLLHMLIYVQVCTCTCQFKSSHKGRPHVRIVTAGFFDWDNKASLSYFAPALVTGLEYLKSQYPHFNWTSEILLDDKVTSCSSLLDNIQLILSRWYYINQWSPDNDVTTPVIITPGCFESAYLNQLASAWDVLLITSADYQYKMADRYIHPTFITASPVTPTLAVIYCSLFRQMGWSRYYLLNYRDSVPYYQMQAGPIMERMLSGCSVVGLRNEFSSKDNSSVVTAVLRDFDEGHRVMLYFGGVDGLRKILLAASQHNMTTGEHVYIAIFPWEPTAAGYFTWKTNSTDDELVRSAYRSVMLITLMDDDLYRGPAVRDLINKWQNVSVDQWIQQNTSRSHDVIQGWASLVAAETAVELAGLVFNEFFAGDPPAYPSGAQLANHLLNRTFDLRVGRVRTLSNGQLSHKNYARTFDSLTGKFKNFMESSNEPITEEYVWALLPEGRWFHRSTFPADKPMCGFSDDTSTHCPTYHFIEWKTAGPGIAFGAIFAFIVFGVILRQRYITEQFEIRTWWKLEWDCLHRCAQPGFCKH